MSKLKVLQITDSLNVGGTEVLAVNMANGFLDENIQSYFCTTRQEGFLKNNLDKNVDYIHVNKKSTIDLKALSKIRKFVKHHNIKIIHAHSTSLFFGVCLKFLVPKVKLFWHNHTGANIYLKGIKFKLICFLTKFVDGIINVNEELNSWSSKRLHHRNTLKLYNFPFFTTHQKTTTLFGEEGKRIVCLAALRAEKDHLNLLHAFNSIVKKHPSWTLHCIGKDYNDVYSKKIKRYIEENKLDNHVFLYGMCADVKHILQQSSIGVLSSKSEGLPISLLEYGLAKLPVITTKVGECEKVINNSKAIVPSQKSHIFANKLLNIIENPLVRNEISSSLYNNVISIYSKEKFMTSIKMFYTK